MLKKAHNYIWKVVVVMLLVVLLALVRTFEDVLFYDPFLNYFKSNYAQLPIPVLQKGYLFVHLSFRYFLNTICSLAIIYTLFKNWELTKFSAILYAVFFIVLIAAFFAAVGFYPDKMLLFYIRRFLIQPLFVLLFIPAFYFQERASKKNNVS